MPAINYISSSRHSQDRRESGQRVVTEISLESVPDPTPQGAMVTGGAEESSADPVMEDFVTRMAELGYVDGQDYTSETLFQYNSLETLYPEYVSDYEESTANLSVVIGECCYSDLRFWYHSDYLGSIAMVTNGDGEIHQSFLYNPWGEEMSVYEPHGTFDSPYRFNGKELDKETGLAYYGARYYDNQLSMWLSVDALAKDFPSHSPYNFTLNNPTKLVDPDGNAPGDPGNFYFGFGISVGSNGSSVYARYGGQPNLGDFSIMMEGQIGYTMNWTNNGLSGFELRTSLGLNYNNGHHGFTLATNVWGGLGGDMSEISQFTGYAALEIGKFRVAYENDGAPFADMRMVPKDNDSYRTTGVQIGWGDLDMRLNFVTGYRGPESFEAERELGYLGEPVFDEAHGVTYNYGLVQEMGPKYRMSSLTFRNNQTGWEVGWNHDIFRVLGQNKFAHGALVKPQRGFVVTGWESAPILRFQPTPLSNLTTWQ